MSNFIAQNNNYSATSSAGLTDGLTSAQKLQNELNLLLTETNQSGGKWKKQKGGNPENSEEKLKQEFDILMEELRATGSALPAELLEGGKRKKVSSKKGKKLLEGGKRKKVSSKKASKKSSRKQSRELPEAIKQFNRLKKEVIDGLGIKGKEIITIASKIAKHYNEAANKNTDEAIRLFKKELASGEAKKRYDALH